MCAHATTKADRAPEMIPAVEPRAPWRVKHVQALPKWRLRVVFNDGTEGEVDLSCRVHSADAGVFSALVDEQLFASCRIEYGAVVWSNGLDLAPDAMHKAIREHGVWVLS